MDKQRIISNNIKLKYDEKKEKDFLKLGLTISDIHKLLDGRLMISDQMLSKIAKLYKMKKDDLKRDLGQDEYSVLLHNSTQFKYRENQDLIMDIIDTYADFMEMI